MNEKTPDVKRITQWTIVLLAIGLIVFAYLQLSQPQEEKGNTFDVTPSSASLVCSIGGLGSSADELSLFRTLLNAANTRSALRQWLETLDQLDSLRSNNRSWYDLLQTSEITFQTPDALNPSNWSVAIALPSNASGESYMKHWLPDLPKREFKGANLFIGADAGWFELRNCLVISPSVAMLEDIALQADKKNVLAQDEAFNASYVLRSKDVPLHIASRVSETGWLTLDAVFTATGTLLNGFISTSSESAYPLLLETAAGDFSIANALPYETTFLDGLHAESFDSSWQSLNRYYAGSPADSFWSQAWQDLGDTCQCDLNEIMLGWRTGEQGCAVIEITDSLSEAVTYTGIADTANVIDILRPILANQATPTDGIYAVGLPIAFQRNSMPSAAVETNYIIQIDGFLFSAASPLALKTIRAASKHLSERAEFTSLLTQTSKGSGRFIYQSNSEITLLPASLTTLLEGADHWCATTEVSQPGRILVSIALPIRVKDQAPVKAPAALEPAETNLVISEPVNESGRSWSVINHNTQEKETLKHDGKNKLELVDAVGQTLWALDMSPISGDVVQVDALKNNKLQMAFATEGGIYVLDRNGNNLAGFPYLPKPPVTSPLLIADYDNTKKYRLIFGMGDGMLSNVGIDGKATSGWKYQTVNSEPIIRVASAKVGGDDVLIAVSKNGAVQLLKRTGEVKTSCTSVLDGFDGKTLEIIPGNDLPSTSIVYSTATGAKTVQLAVQ